MESRMKTIYSQKFNKKSNSKSKKITDYNKTPEEDWRVQGLKWEYNS